MITRILSLDDDLELLVILNSLLESLGYESLTTVSEQEALLILRTQSIDLFTQDIARPVRGGWDFLRLIKTDPALEKIPVMIISAAPMSSQVEQVKCRGLNFERDLVAYLKKPISVEQLIEGIEAACAPPCTHLK